MSNIFCRLAQALLPQHLTSRFIGYLAEKKLPITQPYIRWYIKHYKVNMQEAISEDQKSYRTFNQFFTRRLKPGVRPIAGDENTIVCPADGLLSEYGDIKQGRLIQAKGVDYQLKDLLAQQQELVSNFDQGKFATIYLSPGDYHRVHMPLNAKLKQMIYVPGKLFSVSVDNAQRVDGLFVKNERVICVFETEVGPMAMILVGAIIVASIHTVWAGKLPVSKQIQVTDYQQQSVQLKRGEEMGHFQLGSTVILLFAKDAVKFAKQLKLGEQVSLGAALAARAHGGEKCGSQR